MLLMYGKSELAIGLQVNFQIFLNAQGQPQATNVQAVWKHASGASSC